VAAELTKSYIKILLGLGAEVIGETGEVREGEWLRWFLSFVLSRRYP